MTLALLVSTLFIPGLFGYEGTPGPAHPDQIHISFGEKLSTVVVTWSTTESTPSMVKFGINGTSEIAHGRTTRFVDGGDLETVRFIHRVHLDGLKPNERYVYRCGSYLGWSKRFSFKTVENYSAHWSPSLLFYGDMGVENARSLPFLEKDVQHHEYDAILHVGDFAYNMHEHNGEQGDRFMRMIEPIAASIPYMTVPGNHEASYNFSHYRNRFSMPGNSESLFYSFNMGPVHFIALDSEPYYFYNAYNLWALLRNQFKWLEKDLKKATSPEEREKRPWIITYAHRPMYCSDDDGDECLSEYNQIRVGVLINDEPEYGLENLFAKYGVDLCIWAHEHSYERSWPMYDYRVYKGSEKHPYKNPKGLVHITSGSAGCRENTDHMIPRPGSWSAFRNSDYGYGRLKIHNATHLHVEQVSVDRGNDLGDGSIIDEIWLIKESHGPYHEAMRDEREAKRRRQKESTPSLAPFGPRAGTTYVPKEQTKEVEEVVSLFGAHHVPMFVHNIAQPSFIPHRENKPCQRFGIPPRGISMGNWIEH